MKIVEYTMNNEEKAKTCKSIPENAKYTWHVQNDVIEMMAQLQKDESVQIKTTDTGLLFTINAMRPEIQLELSCFLFSSDLSKSRDHQLKFFSDSMS